MKNFNSEFFIKNRRSLREACDNDAPIVITANGLVQRAGDSGFVFRQDSNFWYLTGLELAELVLVISHQGEFLILPERNPDLDYFSGAIDLDDLRRVSGIKEIMNQHEGWERLRRLAIKHKFINTCLYKGYDPKHAIFINPSKPRLVSQLKKLTPSVELKEVRKVLVDLRMIKQSPELSAIKQAIKITKDSFETILEKDWYKKNNEEALIDAKFTYEFTSRGGRLAYPSIVAGGKRACTLHYEANNQKLNADELLLIDAGAEFNNYASDITRVYSPSKMSDRQQLVYEAVKDAHDQAIAMLKAGVFVRDVDKFTEKLIGKFLKSQKLITKQESSQIRKYYPHVVSHHLGLDVHDVADYTKPLEAGNVITIEPGIYIPEWSIGVRLEDDILITEDDSINLSASLAI